MRRVSFLEFIVLSFITFGIYPIYYFVTRTEEILRQLNEMESKAKLKELAAAVGELESEKSH